jgi:hypothetical protein
MQLIGVNINLDIFKALMQNVPFAQVVSERERRG